VKSAKSKGAANVPTKKDYYEILGVSRTASEKEIKAAYRKLARKYHPDVNKGDKGSEEAFKEVAEAFAVLSDKEKRAQYDRGGHAAFDPGFNPFAGFDPQQFDFGSGTGIFEDLFGQMFGGGFADAFGRGRRGSRSSRGRGQDLRFETTLPFLDAVKGTTIDLKVPRLVACETCAGSGIQAGQGPSVCQHCGGRGQQEHQQGGLRFAVACPHCGGRGRAAGPPCPGCAGEGRVRREDRVKVRIPAGVSDGATLRLAGKGDAGRAGGPPGNLLLRIGVEPHGQFRRDGRDIYCDVTVGLALAALGGTIQVPTLDGTSTVSLPASTRSGQKLRLRGQGISGNGGQAAGDLYAVIQIQPPASLDARSRELLEEFQRLNPDV
jgi:molecular chaperone DnaJ